jgi:hypothetical protein
MTTATSVKASPTVETSAMKPATKVPAANLAVSSECSIPIKRVEVRSGAGAKVSAWIPLKTSKTIWTIPPIGKERMIVPSEIPTGPTGKTTSNANEWTMAVEEVTMRNVRHSIENEHMVAPVEAPRRPAPAKPAKKSKSYARTK